jgi:hypothetical protein
MAMRGVGLTDEEIDTAWSQSVGSVAAVTLIHAKLLDATEQDRATAIIAEEIRVRLVAGDRPNKNNWKFRPDDEHG